MLSKWFLIFLLMDMVAAIRAAWGEGIAAVAQVARSGRLNSA